jgi:hypothetical protein
VGTACIIAPTATCRTKPAMVSIVRIRPILNWSRPTDSHRQPRTGPSWSECQPRKSRIRRDHADRARRLSNLLHDYEIRPRKDKRGVDLISDALLFGGLWYAGPNAASNALRCAQHYSRSHDAVMRVYDTLGNLIEAQEHKGDFKE